MPHMSPPVTPWVLGPAQGKSIAPWTTAPPTGDKPLMDGLRFGSSPPRQILSLGMTDHKKGKAPRPACAGCALLLSQACATSFRLSDLDAVSSLLPPLCTL